MMRKIRILIVDDAVVLRRLLSDALSRDPALEVAGVAANGRIALAKIPRVTPDIVILDVEMPEMNGLDCLAAIRKSYPALPVIMFSKLTQRAATATLDALTLGANDYVTKPTAGSTTSSLESIERRLIPKIKALCGGVADAQLPCLAAQCGSLSAIPIPPRFCQTRIDIVAIGISTGGPTALTELLPEFPVDFPVPLVVVQHMPPLFTRMLAERLAAKSQIAVEEGAAGRPLSAGKAWLAPGNLHMVLEKQDGVVRIQTTQDPPENSCRPSVDVLFRSVAKIYGAHSLGVIMTGIGRDGLRGCAQIHNAGGQILAQDEATATVWGMPGAVARAGLADSILPLRELGKEILRRLKTGRGAPSARPQFLMKTLEK